MRWTKKEILAFDNLVDAAGHPNGYTRIVARMEMREFVELHGKPKCDAMFAHLESGGAKEDFSDEAPT